MSYIGILINPFQCEKFTSDMHFCVRNLHLTCISAIYFNIKVMTVRDLRFENQNCRYDNECFCFWRNHGNVCNFRLATKLFDIL
jgi:hypothetical protein